MNHFFVPGPLQVVMPLTSPWRDALVQGFGGAIGAFAAFLLGALSSQLGRYKERRNIHRNAVIRLEHTLNQNLDEWSTNKFLTQTAIMTLENINMSYNVLSPVTLVPEFEMEVADLNLLNMYSTYKIDVMRANDSMMSWNRANEINRELLISGRVQYTSHLKNISNQVESGRKLIAFIQKIEEDTEDLLSFVRVYMRKDKKWIDWTFFKIEGLHADAITKEELNHEKEILTSEIEEVQKESKERIQEVEKMIKDN